MRLIRKGTVFALGFFDGVHLGHQTILYACKRMADRAGLATGAITFEDHPQSLFTKNCPGLINTTADRCGLLRRYGVDTILTYPVTPAVMGMPWRDFLMELYRCYGAAGFVCGDDFRFGHKGEGNREKLAEFCREFGLECAIIPEQDLDGSRISSTRIRGFLERGDLENANKLLGHPHILSGEVVPGRQLGRTIGIPTANLSFPEALQPLPYGVYACRAAVDGTEYMAVTNIGTRPTVAGDSVTVEPYLLDFSGDLYGKTITLSFHKFLRPEKKFPTLTDLQLEIRKNIDQTRNFFEKSE